MGIQCLNSSLQVPLFPLMGQWAVVGFVLTNMDWPWIFILSIDNKSFLSPSTVNLISRRSKECVFASESPTQISL